MQQLPDGEVGASILIQAGLTAFRRGELLPAADLFAAERHDEVLEVAGAVLDGLPPRRAHVQVSAHVALTLALLRLGRDDEADLHLADALVTADRFHLALPFVRHGSDALATLVDRSTRLQVDAGTRAFVGRLADVRDHLLGLEAPVELTEREQVILRALAEEGGPRRISARLHVSENTVKTQIRSLYRKLGVASRSEALRVARMRHLIAVDDE